MKAYGLVKYTLANSVICQLLSESGQIRMMSEFSSIQQAIKSLAKYCEKAGYEFEWADESIQHWVSLAKKQYEATFNCPFDARCD